MSSKSSKLHLGKVVNLPEGKFWWPGNGLFSPGEGGTSEPDPAHG